MADKPKKKQNLWLTHVKQYAQKYNIPYGKALSLAKETYIVGNGCGSSNARDIQVVPTNRDYPTQPPSPQPSNATLIYNCKNKIISISNAVSGLMLYNYNTHHYTASEMTRLAAMRSALNLRYQYLDTHPVGQVTYAYISQTKDAIQELKTLAGLPATF